MDLSCIVVWLLSSEIVIKEPDFRKILRRSYDNFKNFVRCIPVLREMYDNAKNLMNSHNIIKTIKRHLCTSYHEIIKHVMLCN